MQFTMRSKLNRKCNFAALDKLNKHNACLESKPRPLLHPMEMALNFSRAIENVVESFCSWTSRTSNSSMIVINLKMHKVFPQLTAQREARVSGRGVANIAHFSETSSHMWPHNYCNMTRSKAGEEEGKWRSIRTRGNCCHNAQYAAKVY